jgi:hypothetical protein
LNFAPFFHNLRKEPLSRYGYFAGALGNSPVIRKVTFAIRMTSFKLLGKQARGDYPKARSLDESLYERLTVMVNITK